MLGQGVPIKDGVSVTQRAASSAVKQGQSSFSLIALLVFKFADQLSDRFIRHFWVDR
jgi:hypothetical protein